MRIQAIRASESLYKAGDKTFAADYRRLTKDADPDVVIQAMLTLNLSQGARQRRADRDDVGSRPEPRRQGNRRSDPARPTSSQGQRPALADTGAGAVNLTVDQRGDCPARRSHLPRTVPTCHGSDGKGAPLPGAADGATLAPPLAGSPRVQGHRDYIVKVLLDGLIGPGQRHDYGAA